MNKSVAARDAFERDFSSSQRQMRPGMVPFLFKRTPLQSLSSLRLNAVELFANLLDGRTQTQLLCESVPARFVVASIRVHPYFQTHVDAIGHNFRPVRVSTRLCETRTAVKRECPAFRVYMGVDYFLNLLATAVFRLKTSRTKDYFLRSLLSTSICSTLSDTWIRRSYSKKIIMHMHSIQLCEGDRTKERVLPRFFCARV